MTKGQGRKSTSKSKKSEAASNAQDQQVAALHRVTSSGLAVHVASRIPARALRRDSAVLMIRVLKSGAENTRSPRLSVIMRATFRIVLLETDYMSFSAMRWRCNLSTRGRALKSKVPPVRHQRPRIVPDIFDQPVPACFGLGFAICRYSKSLHSLNRTGLMRVQYLGNEFRSIYEGVIEWITRVAKSS
jgi:hypothetical protein